MNNNTTQINDLHNTSLNAASGSVSSLLNTPVQFACSETSVMPVTAFKADEYSSPVFVKVTFNNSIKGTGLFVFRYDDIQLILDQLMGKPLDTSAGFEFDEINSSAFTEVMNQIMNSYTTELARITKLPVSYEPSELIQSADGQMIDALLGISNFEAIYVTKASIKADNVLSNSFAVILSENFGDEMIEKARNYLDELAKLREPQQSDQSQANNIPPQNANPAPVQNLPTSPVQQSSVKPFSAFQNNLSQEQLHNLQLLMNVPLELSVEIGTTEKKVDEILSFTNGTVIELDCAADTPVNIIVNGHLIAKGDVVVVDDYFAVRITEIVQSNIMDVLNNDGLYK